MAAAYGRCHQRKAEENEEKQTAKKRDTVLTDVAGKIGSTLGIIAAEAAKVVRPLRAKRARRSRSQAHAPALQETSDSLRPFDAAAHKRAQAGEAE
jgi:hypothetical protein